MGFDAGIQSEGAFVLVLRDLVQRLYGCCLDVA